MAAGPARKGKTSFMVLKTVSGLPELPLLGWHGEEHSLNLQPKATRPQVVSVRTALSITTFEQKPFWK